MPVVLQPWQSACRLVRLYKTQQNRKWLSPNLAIQPSVTDSRKVRVIAIWFKALRPLGYHERKIHSVLECSIIKWTRSPSMSSMTCISCIFPAWIRSASMFYIELRTADAGSLTHKRTKRVCCDVSMTEVESREKKALLGSYGGFPRSNFEDEDDTTTRLCLYEGMHLVKRAAQRSPSSLILTATGEKPVHSTFSREQILTQNIISWF